MFINEVSKNTNLTKKAIEYYIGQGLISPAVLENGYRDFSEDDRKLLSQISVLRKLDISTDEIKAVLSDRTNTALQKISVRKEMEFQRETTKKAILNKLSNGTMYSEISLELLAIEKAKTITEKLLDAFPGFYGRFICLHFARFLNVTITTESQETAWQTVISFLDNVPDLTLPEYLQDYLVEGTRHIGTEQAAEMMESTKNAIENIDDFLSSNKEVLEQYLAYRQSEAYKNSPACKVMELMKQFFSTSGYYDVFIPAMKILSPSYADYYTQLETANEKLLAQYPEMEKLSLHNLNSSLP